MGHFSSVDKRKRSPEARELFKDNIALPKTRSSTTRRETSRSLRGIVLPLSNHLDSSKDPTLVHYVWIALQTQFKPVSRTTNLKNYKSMSKEKRMVSVHLFSKSNFGVL